MSTNFAAHLQAQLAYGQQFFAAEPHLTDGALMALPNQRLYVDDAAILHWLGVNPNQKKLWKEECRHWGDVDKEYAEAWMAFYGLDLD